VDVAPAMRVRLSNIGRCNCDMKFRNIILVQARQKIIYNFLFPLPLFEFRMRIELSLCTF